MHRRRPRYAGKFPRRFEEKYKEHQPQRYGDTVAKVLAAGKTPAGTHRPILVAEILEVLAPKPGDVAVDCTLGYGGHAQELLSRILPGGRLVGLDADPEELPKAEARLRALGFGPDVLQVQRTNFAGVAQALSASGLTGADLILADLGVSSMQLDNPGRGFSHKFEGPLDMRMNPRRGEAASRLLSRLGADELEAILRRNADEPHAHVISRALASKMFSTTTGLRKAIVAALPPLHKEALESSIRRVFQALRIEVNDEFSALENLLRQLPACLNSGGRAAILTFHSGEDRRVKAAFEAGLRSAVYCEISQESIRASAEERRSNPRSLPAKLRWARRS